MGRKPPKGSIEEKTEIFRDVKFSFVGRLSTHGASFHIRVPKPEIEFYELLPGDQLHVNVDSAKIERPTSKTA